MKSLYRVLILFLPAVVGLSVAGVVGASPAGAVAPSSTFTCTGTVAPPSTVNPEVVPPGTYGSLVMPAGSFCVVTGAVTVQHGITLGLASALTVVEGTVPGFGGPFFGALTVQGPVSVGPDANLGVYWDCTTPFTATPFTLNGPVTVEFNGLLALLQSSVRGPVSATDPSAVYLYDSSVSGGVSIVGGGGQNDPEQTFINAGLLIPPYRFVDVEGNLIGGPFSVIGYSSPGSSYGYALVLITNIVRGPVTLIGNSVESPGTYSIGSESNRIFGPAECMWNSPTIDDIAPSTVTGPILGAQGDLCFG